MRIFTVILFLSFSLYANTKNVKIESTLVNMYKNISFFVEKNSLSIKELTGIKPKKIRRLIKKIQIAVVSQNLSDKYGVKRDALNFPRKRIIVFNKKSIEYNIKKPQRLYALLLHELFGLLEVEINNPLELRSKNYEYSSIVALQMINPGVMAYKNFNMVQVPLSFCSESLYHRDRYQCIETYQSRMIHINALQVCELAQEHYERITCINQLMETAYSKNQIDMCKVSNTFAEVLQCFMDVRSKDQQSAFFDRELKYIQSLKKAKNNLTQRRISNQLKSL